MLILQYNFISILSINLKCNTSYLTNLLLLVSTGNIILIIFLLIILLLMLHYLTSLIIVLCLLKTCIMNPLSLIHSYPPLSLMNLSLMNPTPQFKIPNLILLTLLMSVLILLTLYQTFLLYLKGLLEPDICLHICQIMYAINPVIHQYPLHQVACTLSLIIILIHICHLSIMHTLFHSHTTQSQILIQRHVSMTVGTRQ
jgi:hypothetical protein